MHTVPLSDIFDIVYGSQLDLNKLEIDLENGINFISRSRENLGVHTKIKSISNKTLFKKGGITVALGGSVLSSFVQQKDFYTGQNIKVLTPKQSLTDLQKKFYCIAIEFNAYRYSACGREANKTLNDLLVPSIDSIPKWVNTVKIKKPNKKAVKNKIFELNTKQWKYFTYDDIFYIKKGISPKIQNKGNVFLISATSLNNGVSKTITSNSIPNNKNLITVSSNGAVGDAFYQSKKFYATGDVNILTPKFKINPFIAIFVNAIIKQEQFKFNYGRKWGKEKMMLHKIKLPINKNNKPDWKLMEDYIKSLPYSESL